LLATLSLGESTRFLATIYETTNFLYVDSTKNSMRIIQPDLYLSMDYIVLAHWIMGEGAKKKHTMGLLYALIISLKKMLLI